MSGAFVFLASARMLLEGILGINWLDQDATAQVGGGDQKIKVLSEMNELQNFENGNRSRGTVRCWGIGRFAFLSAATFDEAKYLVPVS